MPQSGLTDRLNQHSQRTGPLLGCGMALAMMVCVVTGIFLYVRLDEYRVDIFGVATVVQSVPTLPPQAGTPRTTRTVVAGLPGEPKPGEPVASAEPPTPTPPGPIKFRITRTQGEILNMREAANTQATIVARLPPGTVVEYAGEQINGPAGGQTVPWRKVRTASGQLGWVPDQFLERVDG